MRLFLIVLSLMPLWSLAASDIRNSRDNTLLERFPRSYIVQYKEHQDDDYRLALGELEKINGVWAPEKEQRLSGKLQRITYRIPENHTPNEVFSFFVSQLEGLSAKQLFSCVGRDCGSSNQWANSIFRYSRLYGVDKTQSYASYQLANQYFTLYSVRRGNKRVYLRLEVLESDELSLLDSLNQGISAELELDAESVEVLHTYLQQNKSKGIWLVVRDHGSGSFAERLMRSEKRANELKQKLVDAGVQEARIKIHPLGGFSGEFVDKRSSVVVFSEEF